MFHFLSKGLLALLIYTSISNNIPAVGQNVPASVPQKQERSKEHKIEFGTRLLQDSFLSSRLFLGDESKLEFLKLARPVPQENDLQYWTLAACLRANPKELVRVIERHLESSPKSVDANTRRYSLHVQYEQYVLNEPEASIKDDWFSKHVRFLTDVNELWTDSKSEARDDLIAALAEKDATMGEFTIVDIFDYLLAFNSPTKGSTEAPFFKLLDRGNMQVVKAIIDSPNADPNNLLSHFSKFERLPCEKQTIPVEIELAEAVLKRFFESRASYHPEPVCDAFNFYFDDLTSAKQLGRGIEFLDAVEAQVHEDEDFAELTDAIVFRNRVVLQKHIEPSLVGKIAAARIEECSKKFESEKDQFPALMEAFEFSFLTVDSDELETVIRRFKDLGFFDISKLVPLFVHRLNDESEGNKIAYSNAIQACFNRLVSEQQQPRFFPDLKRLSEIEGMEYQAPGAPDPSPMLDEEPGWDRLLNLIKFDLALASFAEHAHSRTLLNEIHLETENWRNREPKSKRELEGKVVVLLLQDRYARLSEVLRNELDLLSRNKDVFFSALERGTRESWRPPGTKTEAMASPHKFPVIEIYNNTLSCELLDYLEASDLDKSEHYRILIFDKSGNLRRLAWKHHRIIERIESTVQQLISE